MRHKRQWVTIGAGMLGLCLLTGVGEAGSLLAKTETSENAAAAESKQIQWQVKLPQALDGQFDLFVGIYTDEGLTQSIDERIYPDVPVQEGIAQLSLPVKELGLENGKNYWAKIAVAGREDTVTVGMLNIVPEQLIQVTEAGKEDSNGPTIMGKYDITGNYPYPDYVARITNTSSDGYATVARASGGTAVYAKTSGTGGYGVLAENPTGTALYSKGKAEVEGDLTVTGQANLAAVDLPDGSVTTNDIYDGTIRQNDLGVGSVTSTQIQDGSIVNADISSTAAIAGSKIDRTGLDADLFDGLDSTAFVRTTGDLTLSGNLTVNGTGNNLFAGNVGIGMSNLYPDRTLEVAGLMAADNLAIRNNVDNTPYLGIGTTAWWGGERSGVVIGAYSPILHFATNSSSNLKMTLDADGNLGVGTEYPSQKLDVVGTIQTQGFKLTTGATNGYILTSDVSGAGTWQPAPGGGGGGDITGVTAGPGLTGGGESGNVTLSVGSGSITSGMITDGTIAQADVSNGYIDLVNEQNIAGRKVFTSNVFFNGQTGPNAVNILTGAINALEAVNNTNSYAAIQAKNLSLSGGSPTRGMGVHAEVSNSSFIGIGTNGKGYFGGGFATSLETSKGQLMMTSPLTRESEIYISGSGEMNNGQVEVSFDAEMKEVITDVDLKVIVTPTSMCQGLAVVEKNSHGFIVQELGNGNGSATFDWLAIVRKAKSSVDSSAESMPEVPLAEVASAGIPTK